MTQKANAKKGRERPSRQAIRRSAEYKAKLSAASDLLAGRLDWIGITKEESISLSRQLYADLKDSTSSDFVCISE
ncbi:hypothetical protein [Serratia sp. 201]|uniref:hypothetical protein n=1 Tax=Serratia sp. 201 TaxID=3096764 RepID=UPI00300BD78E